MDIAPRCRDRCVCQGSRTTDEKVDANVDAAIFGAGKMIVTASLSTGSARVAYGLSESMDLIDEIMAMEHERWESVLYIGDAEFRVAKSGGPYPNHQLRVSVKPSLGYAALNYMDHDDPELAIANSYNPNRPLQDIHLIFNGDVVTYFPQTAAIPIADVRQALAEWLHTRRRPTCIEWRPYDRY